MVFYKSVQDAFRFASVLHSARFGGKVKRENAAYLPRKKKGNGFRQDTSSFCVITSAKDLHC